MRAPRFRSFIAASLLVTGLALYACGDDSPGESPSAGGPETGTPSETGSGADSASGDGPIVLDSATDGSGDADADAPLLSPTFVFRDINQVLATGQSLSVGALGTPTLSLTQPYDNTMFVTGVVAGGAGLTSLSPLVEGNVETMSSSFASLITKLARDVVLVGQPAGKTSHDLLISAHGIGGTAYVGLEKGTAAYANGLAQAQAGHDLAIVAGKTHVVRAVTNVHGESDSQNGNVNYEANLLEWQSNYETDVKAITGQVESIPMLHTQFSSWTRLSGFPTTSIIPAAQLAAHVSAPGKIILVGAKYHLPYVADGVHLTSEGYRHMGEDYAKVYRRVILEGKTWEPVRPKTVTRAGAVITVKMFVPAPPLVMDTTIVSDPGNKGFEWAGGAESIASVALTGPDTVVITLSAAPAAAGRLRYAFTGTSGALGGPPPARAATCATRTRRRHATATRSTTGASTSMKRCRRPVR